MMRAFLFGLICSSVATAAPSVLAECQPGAFQKDKCHAQIAAAVQQALAGSAQGELLSLQNSRLVALGYQPVPAVAFTRVKKQDPSSPDIDAPAWSEVSPSTLVWMGADGEVLLKSVYQRSEPRRCVHWVAILTRASVRTDFDAGTREDHYHFQVRDTRTVEGRSGCIRTGSSVF